MGRWRGAEHLFKRFKNHCNKKKKNNLKEPLESH